MPYELLLRETNAIYDIVTAYGFAGSDFRWTFRYGAQLGWQAGEFPTLEYGDGEFFFALANYGSRGWKASYSPGTDSRHSVSQNVSWEGVLHECEAWANYLRDEANQSDKWEGVTQHARVLLERSSEDSNRPFSSREQIELGQRLDALVREVSRTQSLSKIQTQMLLSAIEEAKGAAARLGRKDWILLFGGLLLQLGIGALIEPAATRVIGQGASAVINWVLGQPALLP